MPSVGHRSPADTPSWQQPLPACSCGAKCDGAFDAVNPRQHFREVRRIRPCCRPPRVSGQRPPGVRASPNPPLRGSGDGMSSLFSLALNSLHRCRNRFDREIIYLLRVQQLVHVVAVQILDLWLQSLELGCGGPEPRPHLPAQEGQQPGGEDRRQAGRHPQRQCGQRAQGHHRQGAAAVERCHEQHRNDGTDDRSEGSYDDLSNVPLARHFSGPSASYPARGAGVLAVLRAGYSPADMNSSPSSYTRF